MQNLDEIKEEKKVTVILPDRNRYSLVHGCCGHRVINREMTNHSSSYPRISPLEADLMDLMGDSLGG